MERLKGQYHNQDIAPQSPAEKLVPFAPTLLKNMADKARRRVLRAASRLRFWHRTQK
jgi:hypothetical protein